MSTRPVIMGELGLLSLFDLAQLLMLNGATGTLHVAMGGRKGFFRFERGQIANARDERLREGEDAAYHLFGWRAGTFEFSVEPPTGGRTIHDSTEGLMLEAARRLDEAGVDAGGGSLTEALQARAGKFEALREAFQRVAADITPGTTDIRPGARFTLLSEPGDTLLYRPGSRVRILRAGGWQESDDGPLDPTSFEQLAASLFEGVASDGTPRTVTVNENGREMLVTRWPAPQDALLVRAVAVAGGDAPSLAGDEAAIDQVLDLRAGLVLVGAPGIRAAEQLLHATLSRLLARRSLTVLLTAERGRPAYREAQGAVLLTPRAGLVSALDAFAPDAIAFDVAHADASLEALHRVPLVMCAVVAADAASLLPRWLARHGLTSTAPERVALAGAEVGVLFTAASREQQQPLAVVAACAAGRAPAGGKATRGVTRLEPAGDAALPSVIAKLQRELRDAA